MSMSSHKLLALLLSMAMLGACSRGDDAAPAPPPLISDVFDSAHFLQYFNHQPSLNLMDISVQRNAFGRQVDSFQTDLEVKGLDTPFPAMFIRAPVIGAVGEGVDVLARQGDQVVLARQGNLLASSFHPELTRDARIHELFLTMIPQVSVPVSG